MSVTVILLISLAAAFWLLRNPRIDNRPKPAKRKRPAPRQRRVQSTAARGSAAVASLNPYLSASIRQGSCACPAVKELGNQRYLSREVPQVPLPECTSARCDCRYQRHEDRRTSGDRRSPFGLQADLYHLDEHEERRQRHVGRRRTDSAGQAVDFDYDDIEWTT